MFRSQDEEFRNQLALRKKYLEDPNYRRWSDIVPGGLDSLCYIDYRDDALFERFITNRVGYDSNASELVSYLNKGHELPINWSNFYAYFDERLNDPQNRHSNTLLGDCIAGGYDEPRTSVKKLLNRYRDHLLSNYDIV